MNSPQQSLAMLAARPAFGADAVTAHLDEDVPLGCESAYPSLQIDCWGEEGGHAGHGRD